MKSNNESGQGVEVEHQLRPASNTVTASVQLAALLALLNAKEKS